MARLYDDLQDRLEVCTVDTESPRIRELRYLVKLFKNSGSFGVFSLAISLFGCLAPLDPLTVDGFIRARG